MPAKKIVRMTQSNQFPVGTVISSRLSEINFQAIMGPSWVLYDDRDVSGSELDNLESLPGGLLDDARGLAIRGKNNSRVDGSQNPDGDLALGTFQDHQHVSHNHGGGSHTHAQRINNFTGSGGFLSSAPYAPNTTTSITSVLSTNGPNSTVVATNGGNETRMRCLTLNTFIKINP